MPNGPEGGGQPLFRQTSATRARQRLARERAARTTRQAISRARREQARRDIEPERRQVISQFRRIDTQVSGARGGQPVRSATRGRVRTVKTQPSIASRQAAAKKSAARLAARREQARKAAAKTTAASRSRARREQDRRDIEPERVRLTVQTRKTGSQTVSARAAVPPRIVEPRPKKAPVKPPGRGPRPVPKQVKPPPLRLGGGLKTVKPQKPPGLIVKPRSERPGVRPSAVLSAPQKLAVKSQVSGTGVPAATITPLKSALGDRRIETIAQGLEERNPRKLNKILNTASKSEKRLISAVLLKRDFDRRNIGAKGMELRRKRRLLKLQSERFQKAFFALEVKAGRQRPRGFPRRNKGGFR